MSLVPLLTHASPAQNLWAPYYNVGNMNASTISTGSITANDISVSSLVGDHISCISLDSEYINTSTMNAISIDLDGQILTAAPGEILLNGIPLATLSSLSSIGDWSLEPAISTVQMAGNDLNAAGTISSGNVRAGNGFFTNLIAFNALFVSTTTSTISTQVNTADIGFYSTLNAGNLTVSTNTLLLGDLAVAGTGNISSVIGVSSINGFPIGHYEPGGVSTVSTFQTASISSLEVSSINGGPIISGANWSQYPANSVVDLANNQIYNATVINGPNNLVLNAPSGLISSVCEDLEITADEGANITTNATISLTAKNGYQGQIDIVADTGFADIGGVVNITANGGVTPLGVGWGGEINLTATTGTFTTLSFTSAVNLNAAGINSYAGATAPIGSLAGGNFVHGDSIVNITAGIPPIFSDPGCVYLRGTNGILMDSATYMKGPLRPYSDVVQNPTDLYIEDYSNLITHGYVQLRGISTATFAGGDTAILGLNKCSFSSIGGEVTGLSSINGLPIGDFTNISSISSLNEWALFPALSSINANGGDILNIRIAAFSSIGGEVTGLSSINGLPISDFTNISSISSLNEWALYPALSTIDANGNDILNARIVNCSTIDVPLLNGGIISTGQITNCSSMNAGVISTAYIQGANSNLFNLGLLGLEIDATNLFLSTPSVVHPGSFNGSTILANSAIVKQSGVSSLTASTITTNILSTSLVQSGLFLVSSFNINVLATISTTNTAILNADLISSGRFTASSISLNSGVYSTLLVPQATTNPGVGTSTMLTVNTDLNLGNNDLYAQQVRLGKGQADNFAEILMYANDGSTRNLLSGTADRTFRVASSVAPTGPGYVLDTTMNPPFFSTINQSTAMMSYFPSTINNTIGVSTIGYIPPKVVAGQFASLSTQNMTINTPLAIWMEQTDYTVGGLVTSTNTIVVPSNGVFEIIPSIQFEHPLGAATADFWLRKNGTDVPNTASEVYLPTGGLGQTLGVTSYILPCSAGDKLQIMVASPDTGCSVAFFQSTVTTPYTKPANPSVIVSMKCLNY